MAGVLLKKGKAQSDLIKKKKQREEKKKTRNRKGFTESGKGRLSISSVDRVSLILLPAANSTHRQRSFSAVTPPTQQKQSTTKLHRSTLTQWRLPLPRRQHHWRQEHLPPHPPQTHTTGVFRSLQEWRAEGASKSDCPYGSDHPQSTPPTQLHRSPVVSGEAAGSSTVADW